MLVLSSSRRAAPGKTEAEMCSHSPSLVWVLNMHWCISYCSPSKFIPNCYFFFSCLVNDLQRWLRNHLHCFLSHKHLVCLTTGETILIQKRTARVLLVPTPWMGIMSQHRMYLSMNGWHRSRGHSAGKSWLLLPRCINVQAGEMYVLVIWLFYRSAWWKWSADWRQT